MYSFDFLRPCRRLYYTQFIGNPADRPIIVGSSDFVGIGLIDTDVYIPGGNSQQW